MHYELNISRIDVAQLINDIKNLSTGITGLIFTLISKDTYRSLNKNEFTEIIKALPSNLTYLDLRNITLKGNIISINELIEIFKSLPIQLTSLWLPELNNASELLSVVSTLSYKLNSLGFTCELHEFKATDLNNILKARPMTVLHPKLLFPRGNADTFIKHSGELFKNVLTIKLASSVVQRFSKKELITLGQSLPTGLTYIDASENNNNEISATVQQYAGRSTKEIERTLSKYLLRECSNLVLQYLTGAEQQIVEAFIPKADFLSKIKRLEAFFMAVEDNDRKRTGRKYLEELVNEHTDAYSDLMHGSNSIKKELVNRYVEQQKNPGGFKKISSKALYIASWTTSPITLFCRSVFPQKIQDKISDWTKNSTADSAGKAALKDLIKDFLNDLREQLTLSNNKIDAISDTETQSEEKQQTEHKSHPTIKVCNKREQKLAIFCSQLLLLSTKANELNSQVSTQASNIGKTLHLTLKKLKESYCIGTINLTTFKNRTTTAIDTALIELKTEDGWGKLLDNITRSIPSNISKASFFNQGNQLEKDIKSSISGMALG